MDNKKEKILYSRETIMERIRELAKDLDKVYEGKDLLVIGLLRGSFIFLADLIREMDSLMEVDFLTTSSYENREISSGEVKIFHDLRAPVEGRHVLIVDDIADTGHTLSQVVDHIGAMKPASLKTCVLLDKPDRRQVEIDPDYVAFRIPDLFIVGYGLNYGAHYRNIPYIYAYIDDED
ncbi:MAG: hypoxanthine phosphoribosyltransferase [Tissierellia bacterium]|nr:hypoxanthine phosphoribosyltransferase [Tissierellia bacterium]